jgi:bifunctional non-homologous end joining protein LigD
MAFDLLYFDGHDLRNSELDMRRHLLEDLVPAGGEGDIRFSEEIEADGDQLLASACELDLEGIIAKQRRAPYRSGRLGEWLKIKCVQSDGFAIIGYEKSTASFGGIGRLLLAARKGEQLVYVGGVGTGFNERSAAELRSQMDKLIIGNPAVDTGRKRNAIFVRPELVAEIQYGGWTHDRKLRHPSYKGLREVQDNAGIYEIA